MTELNDDGKRRVFKTRHLVLAVTTALLAMTGCRDDGPDVEPPGSPAGTTPPENTTDETVDREVGPASGSMPAMDE